MLPEQPLHTDNYKGMVKVKPNGLEATCASEKVSVVLAHDKVNKRIYVDVNVEVNPGVTIVDINPIRLNMAPPTPEGKNIAVLNFNFHQETMTQLLAAFQAMCDRQKENYMNALAEHNAVLGKP